ncbi:MAG: glycogen debranching protein GlgX [Chloroflexota bacterium]
MNQKQEYALAPSNDGSFRSWRGRPYRLGATWDGSGVNFAIFSEHASGVELCLFDHKDSPQQIAGIPIKERTDLVWHVYIPDLRPGQLYGYRVHGPYEPQQGHRFNPAKLVLDPYGKAISGTVQWNDALYGYRINHADADLSKDDRDSAPFIAKSVVVDPAFDWEGDSAPRIPWHETIIYEIHLKGLTACHPGVPKNLRGTYAGLVSPPVLDYLRSLGITAVELMPVHHSVPERHLVERGLTNYWGYNSIGFFAPDARYSSSGTLGEQVTEFKQMVKMLHRAGIEVILDVVYNHTAEGNHLGPTLCFRGVDNSAYYRLASDSRYYVDYTGCGNTLNMIHPRTLQLIMDSLRYWVLEMHVDGFRFDLAATLARGLHEVDRLGAFFDIIHQDPVISQVKLIAEPWDLGAGGYQVGNFPVGWAEWNGKYRDAIRKYWRGDRGLVSDVAYRLTGSSDLYQSDGRRPYASINFVTCHDGFTLADLVSYNAKHNEANGEGNRDGTDDNLSWNCGVEGPSDNPSVLALRERQIRNFLTTLFVSEGVPMLCAGDEVERTQRGNNNAYCQDNELSWFDWHIDPRRQRFLEFTRKLIRLRLQHPELHRRKFFQGRPLCDASMKDLVWFRPDGGEMTDSEWSDTTREAFGYRLCGLAMDEVNDKGEPITDDTLLIVFNGGVEKVQFVLPDAHPGKRWELLVDTASTEEVMDPRKFDVGSKLELLERSMMLLRAC